MTKRGARPRLGFLGTGWIGRHRLKAIQASGDAEVAAIADTSRENAAEAGKIAPQARLVDSLDDLLTLDLDGIVIATPSAFHCAQAVQALSAGLPVFCQKPVGRNAQETELVVSAARGADRFLGVDFSYRFTEGIQRMHRLASGGELGKLYAADLVFHNAYGPDKDWFYRPDLSGGGCLIDLGTHLVDLALWFFGFPAIRCVSSAIYAQGERLKGSTEQVEDYAAVSMVLEDGSVVRLACSWNISAGQDAVIESTFHGTKGGVSFRNVNGSFYDFIAEHFRGRARETLALPPDDWGGRAALAWVRRLREEGAGFDPQAEQLVSVAAALDAAYGR